MLPMAIQFEWVVFSMQAGNHFVDGRFSLRFRELCVFIKWCALATSKRIVTDSRKIKKQEIWPLVKLGARK